MRKLNINDRNCTFCEDITLQLKKNSSFWELFKRTKDDRPAMTAYGSYES